MSDFSEQLRAARERLGLTVEDVSARTRIKADMLRALERGDTSRLPGAFYTRAFIRTYAREVDLPADELVADFVASEQPVVAPAVRLEDIPPIRRTAGFEAPRATTWQLVPIAAIVVAGIIFFGTRGPGGGTPGREPGAVGSTGIVPAGLGPVSNADEPVSTTGTAAPAERLSLEIKPAGPVWVAATADGERVLYRLLNPGERTVVEARDEIALRVGDAAAFVYRINGSDGLPLGAPGEVRDLRITRENYATLRR